MIWSVLHVVLGGTGPPWKCEVALGFGMWVGQLERGVGGCEVVASGDLMGCGLQVSLGYGPDEAREWR